MCKYILMLVFTLFIFSENSNAKETIKLKNRSTNMLEFEFNSDKDAEFMLVMRKNEIKASAPKKGMSYVVAEKFVAAKDIATTGTGNVVVMLGKPGQVTKIINIWNNKTYAIDIYQAKSEAKYSKKLKTVTLSTLPHAPVDAAKNLNFQAKNSTLVVQWKRGTGEKAFLLVAENEKMTYPADGTEYKSGKLGGTSNRVGKSNTYVIAVTKNFKNNKYTVKGLKNSSEYTFALLEANGSKDAIVYKRPSGKDNNPRSFVSPLDPPKALAASDVGTDQFIAAWEEVTGAKSYEIDIAYDKKFKKKHELYNSLSVPVTNEFGFSDLKNGTEYYYRIRAINGKGASQNSNTIKVVTEE